MFTGHDFSQVAGPVLSLGPEITGWQGCQYDEEDSEDENPQRPPSRGPVQCHFHHLQQALQLSLPGTMFAPEMSMLPDGSCSGHPAIKILHDRVWKWGHQDKLFALCLLNRKLPGHCGIFKGVLGYIGPVNVLRSPKRPCTFDTPYKVLNFRLQSKCIHGWFDMGSNFGSIEVAGWHSDVTHGTGVHGSWSMEGAHELEIQLIAARGAPAWTEAELESVLEALGEHFCLRPKRWREGCRYVSRAMAKQLRDASGCSFFNLGYL